MADNQAAADQLQEPQRIGISQARARGYELLRRVKAGETFIITYRGVDKARLEPVPPDHPVMREWLARQAKKESKLQPTPSE
jgi:prevent-host-death family protein